VLESIELLADAVESFRVRCVAGLQIDRARIDELLHRSLMLVTALAPRLGYDRAAKVAQHAHARGITLRDSVVELGVMSGAEFDRLVRPERMVGPRRTRR
ncbi:MAG TPA: class II fumarate hydratase, partial [Planctomycetota bacterium]|nr:class II fumarate hydratase [Planctomycetota bacterium]